MSSLASLVAASGAIRRGDPDGADVKMLQLALQQAGYRVADDGEFGPRTEMVLAQFQKQHGLKSDGVLGPLTAALLDAPHQTLIETATPLTSQDTVGIGGTVYPAIPHDDSASLLAFYGKPWQDSSLITHISCPWILYYEGHEWPHPIQFHVKGAAMVTAAFNKIWDACGKNNESSMLVHVKIFSGSGNYRPIRGSSRLSCHAFWAAIDFDSEKLPLGIRKPTIDMPTEIVEAFDAANFFWGGRFIGRPDPQHFQLAHE